MGFSERGGAAGFGAAVGGSCPTSLEVRAAFTTGITGAASLLILSLMKKGVGTDWIVTVVCADFFRVDC